ncbi:MAG: PEP-CTERM sorting domain-containing protein [Verrucomicrobia bacterium]|nr:PEP-CTERM sorting domain-containing protein [Verrucomicrobiota bacterium]MCH8513491.1 PEP-CTERM sorting domain-containing protein [Kiritimatiellia bacterium]
MKKTLCFTAITLFLSAQALANSPVLLIDFNHQRTINEFSLDEGGAPGHDAPDANGNYWNTIHREDIGKKVESGFVLTHGTPIPGFSVDTSDGYGNPTSTGQWSGASPARAEFPSWVPSNVPNSENPLDDRANVGNQSTASLVLEGLPVLAPGQWFRIEVVSAATGNFGTDAPALWNIEGGNSVGGNQSGNEVGSLVPFNGLTGNDLEWRDNGGSNSNRFGYAFFPNTSADTSIAPADGWIVWDGILPDGNNAITIHSSTYATSSGDQRAPVNALAVYVIPEPGSFALLLVGALFVFRRRLGC